jgi:hypothetical protein
MTMRQSQTAVLERGATVSDTIRTEPYETAWASEARWFVRIEKMSPGAGLRLQAQVSPDGLEWVDHEGAAFSADTPGLVTRPLRGFGSWLRLLGEVLGPDASVQLTIYLALKA